MKNFRRVFVFFVFSSRGQYVLLSTFQTPYLFTFQPPYPTCSYISHMLSFSVVVIMNKKQTKQNKRRKYATLIISGPFGIMLKKCQIQAAACKLSSVLIIWFIFTITGSAAGLNFPLYCGPRNP